MNSIGRYGRSISIAVAVAATAFAQDVAPADALAKTAAGRWLTEFLATVNTGDLDEISELAGGRDSRAAYFWSLHQEFGPLSFGLRDGDVFWCRGDLTKAWVGLVAAVAGSNVDLRGVRRGIRPAGAPRSERVPPGELGDYLRGYLKPLAANRHFAGAVLVAKDGKVLFQGAYGLADRERVVDNTLDTKFRLASVTKTFVGVAICQLVERGKLKFSDTIDEIIPEYPEHIASQVTVHHLLTHTSGIELDDYGPYNAAVLQAESLDDLLAAQVEHIEHLNLGNHDDFEPLGRFDYTNEGIDLLGVIIERVAEQPWEEYLQQHVFEPAGMNSTGLINDRVDHPGMAVGYSLRTADRRGRVKGPRRRVEAGTMGVLGKTARPAGSGYSTVGDMHRFVEALRTGKILGVDYWATMTEGHVEDPVIQLPNFKRSYGYTVDIRVTDGVRAFGHSGGAPGQSTMLDIFPDSGYVVIVLSNFDHAARNVSGHIEDIVAR